MTAIAKLRAPLPSLAERMAAGKALRAKVPRKSHGDFAPAPDRRDPVPARPRPRVSFGPVAGSPSRRP